MRLLRNISFAMALCLCGCACESKADTDKKGEEGTIPDATKDVTAYVSTADAKSLFKKSEFKFSDTNVLDSYNVRYDKTDLGKKVDGFGLAITTATCYNLTNNIRNLFCAQIIKK